VLFRSQQGLPVSIDLDMLPTGRPCWVPGEPGDLLFPAGDGQLHRCHLTRDQNVRAGPSDQSGMTASSARGAKTHAVTWRCPVPGSGNVFISDPVWPCEKQLRKFLFVSLSVQTHRDGKLRFEPPGIWWLEMSELGYEILAAGRLTEPAISSDASRTVNEGMPNVTSGPSGQVTFAYLTRTQTETSWRLCLTALSLEKGTGKPVIARTPAPIEVVADGLLPIPPTFSTDGQAVFAPTEDGQIKKYSLAKFAGATRPPAID